MDISVSIKNQILLDNIDLLKLTQNKIRQWLVSNFVNILCDNKIYIEKVSVTPQENKEYNFLYIIEASNENQTYLMEFGELKINNLKRITEFKSDRLLIINMKDDFDKLCILKNLNDMRYNLSVINNRKTLILF